MKAKCPEEILTTEGTDVKYFKDFEYDNSQVSQDKVTDLFLFLLTVICHFKVSETKPYYEKCDKHLF